MISKKLVSSIYCLCDSALLFTIRVGSNSLNSNDPNALRLSTDTYFLHPDYDPTTLSNDLGLIKLRMKITLTGITTLESDLKLKTNNQKF
jgi:hypothetical protein